MELRALRVPGGAAALLAACLIGAGSTLRAQDSAAAAAEPRLVSGFVCDEHGAPLADAAIAVLASGAPLDVNALLKAPTTRSDEHGRYQLDLADAGSWPSVVIAARDRQACSIRPATSSGADLQQLPDAVLVPGVQLIGRVRGPDGAALAGAHVGVDGSLRGASTGTASLRSGAFVNSRGIFVVPCVPRSGLRVTIRCPGYVGCTQLAAQESPLDVTLQPAAVVRGRLLDADGEPVVDAAVTFKMIASPPPMIPCRTDADGRFAIDVPPDVLVRLEARVEGRSHASELLRGAHDDVVLSEVAVAGDGARVAKLLVRDAASGETLPQVHVSQLMFAASQPVIALFHRHDAGADFAGEAEVPLQRNIRGLLVEAPGHGFELVDVDDGAGDEPLVVSLGPEAVVTGVVTDAETGKPLAGVHVRALPKGNSSGSGGRLDGLTPVSDEQGRYRIAGLRPGEYTVQVHGADRAASRPEAVDVREQREVELALVAPERVWLEVVAEGLRSPGPAPVVRADGLRAGGGGNGFFQHQLTPPVPVTLREPGTTRVGPVAGLNGELLVWVPSRLRVDAGSSLAVAIAGATARIGLERLQSVVVNGRVEAAELPVARVAIVAERVDEGAHRHQTQTVRAGLEAGGQFALDLLPGSYRLSLVDLETNLEFHREADDLEVSATTPPPVLRPQLHWLEVELVAAPAEGELLAQSLRIDVRQTDAARVGFSSFATSGSFTLVPGVRRVRLLLPPGEVTVAATRAMARLGRAATSWQYETVAEQKLSIDRAETDLTLPVPAPPGDDELRREHG